MSCQYGHVIKNPFIVHGETPRWLFWQKRRRFYVTGVAPDKNIANLLTRAWLAFRRVPVPDRGSDMFDTIGMPTGRLPAGTPARPPT